MNLLRKYVPTSSGHIQGIVYDSENATLEIVFFNKPEQFKPILKLVFVGVTNLQEELFDEKEENCIELVIGLDLFESSICLHTDLREINFIASEVVSVPLT